MGLGYVDIVELEKRFPIHTADGRPAWAIGGGGAVMVLSEADFVHGYAIKRGGYYFGRDHKDLDVAVFDATRFRSGQLRYPLEIFRTMYWDALRKCNYHENNPGLGFFYVEFMTGYYSGFPPPSRDETVLVGTKGHFVYTLTPEFLLASRLLSASGIRQGEDTRDADSIMSRFAVDPAKVHAAAVRGPLGFLTGEQIAESLARRNYRELENCIAEEVRRRFSGHFALVSSCLGQPLPEIARGLCAFNPDDIDDARWRQALAFSDDLDWSRISRDSEYLKWYWAVVFMLYHLDCAIPKSLRQALQHNLDAQTRGDAVLRIALTFCREMAELKKGLDRAGLGKEFAYIVPRLAERLLRSDFRGLILAVLSTMRGKLEAAAAENDYDRACAELRAFLNLAGLRKWQPGGGQ